MFLLIAIQRSFAEGESSEGELEGGGVAPDELCGDVQKGELRIFRIMQRSRRHVEEVLRGEVKGVQRGYVPGIPDIVQGDSCDKLADVAMTLAILVDSFAEVHYTSRAVGP